MRIQVMNRLSIGNKIHLIIGLSLVLRTDAGLVSVGVDRLGDVLTVHEGDFERPPEVVCGPARGQIRGAYKLPDRLVLALDTK